MPLPDSENRTRILRVLVGPAVDSDIAASVVAGRGEVVTGAATADAIVWLANDPFELSELLTPTIQWVQLPGAGVENWMSSGVMDGLRLWTNAGSAYADAVAEHALALILAAAKDLASPIRASAWTRPTSRLLRGATILVVGAGRIGRSLIRLLAPFSVTVLAVNRSGREVPGAAATSPPQKMKEFMERADYVVIAAPDTPATYHLISKHELRRMSPTAWLINVSRGRLVDTPSLVEALSKREIGGAALDATDPEPLPANHPLWHEPRAIVTPHIGNPLFIPQLTSLVQENVRRFIEGEALDGLIDLEAGY